LLLDTVINLDPGESWAQILMETVESPGVVVVDYNSPDGVYLYIEYNIPYSNHEIQSFTLSSGQNTGSLWLPVMPSAREKIMPLGLYVENRYGTTTATISLTALYYYLCPPPEPPPR